jgi:hypothetical protein
MTFPTAIAPGPRIDLPHQRIHEGRYFAVTAIDEKLPAGVPKNFMILSPPVFISIAHVISIINVTPGATFEFFEDTVTLNDGTPLNAFNQDRNNPVAAIGFVFEDPTVTFEGILIFSQIIGSVTEGGTGGTKNRDEEEFLFKPLTKYLLKITPLANNTFLSIQMRAYRQATTQGT